MTHRLLCVIPEYPPDFGGGIATFYGALLPALARRGVAVTAIVGSALSPGPAAREEHGVRIIPLDRERARHLATRFANLALAPDLCHHLGAAWAAWEQADGGAGYDSIECSDWGLFFVPWLLKKDGPPTRVRLHASVGQIARHDPQPGFALTEALSQLIEARLLPRAAELVTYGAGNRDWWQATIPAEVALRYPAFTPPDRPSPSDITSERGLVVGRIQTWKGPATLCRALRVLGSESPRFDWHGRSTTGSDGRDLSAALTTDFSDVWGSFITPAAPIPPATVYARQGSARFVVVPSDWDVFNFTAAEAMCAGATVICSEGAGAAGLIHTGENGFRFPARDHTALAGRIRDALALSPSAKARLGAAARETIITELAPDRIAAFEHDALRAAPPVRPAHIDPALDALFTPADNQSDPIAKLPDLDFAGLSRLPLSELARHTLRRTLARLTRRQ